MPRAGRRWWRRGAAYGRRKGGARSARAPLPNEFGADLPDTPSSTDARYLPELAAVKVADGITELGMVENVEEFSPDLDGPGFGDLNRLRQPEVGVPASGAVQEGRVAVAEQPDGFLSKRAGGHYEHVRSAGRGQPGILSDDRRHAIWNIATVHEGSIPRVAERIRKT